MTPARTAVRRLAIARAISVTGSAAAYTALMFEIYDKTGSAAWLAASLLVTEGLTGVVAPLTSVLGDRFDRRRVMILSDLAAAVCFAGMAVASVPGPLVFVALLSAFAEAPFWPASGAAIPNLVPEDQVSWANSLVAVGRNLGIMLGPAIGGLLLAAAGAPAVFLVNAVSFVFGRARRVRACPRFRRPRRRGGRGGCGRVHLLCREPCCCGWRSVVGSSSGRMAMSRTPAGRCSTRAPARSRDDRALGRGPISVAARPEAAPANEARWLVIGTALVAGFSLGVALSPWFGLVLALNTAWGAAEGLTNVADQNIMQRRSPDSVRSRVFGAQEGIWHGSVSVSYIAAAFVLPVVGARGMYAILAVPLRGGHRDRAV